MNWVVAGLIAGVIAYLVDWLMWGKVFTKGMVYGSVLFGMGWAITGACPGPLFAQMGAGFSVVIITFLSALAGTWLYGLLRDKLPH